MQPETPQNKEIRSPFPRWLPLVGIAIGLIYLAIIGLTKDMFGEVPDELPFTISKLAYTGPANGMGCDLANGEAEVLNEKYSTPKS